MQYSFAAKRGLTREVQHCKTEGSRNAKNLPLRAPA